MINTFRKNGTKFRTYYFILFIGYGAFFPLLSSYLLDYVKLPADEAGVLLSINAIIMIVAQPIWGMLCDYTKKPRTILVLLLSATCIFLYLYSQLFTFIPLFITAIVMYFFSTSINPVSDYIASSYAIKNNDYFGRIRLWGSIGFALGSLVVGRIADMFGLHTFFYINIGAFLVALFLVFTLPNERVETNSGSLSTGLKSLLKNKKYLLFLVSMFFIFGPLFANNFYLGVLVQDVGGTLTGVGFAFLLSAGLEAPFMARVTGMIQRFGYEKLFFYAGMIAIFRWLIYMTEPSVVVIYLTAILQGFAFGVLIPAGVAWVRENTDSDIQSTAISVYTAAANGLGSWFCTLLGGKIIAAYDIYTMYFFFALFTMVGVTVVKLQPVILREKVSIRG